METTVQPLSPQVLEALQRLGNEKVKNWIREIHPELLPENEESDQEKKREALRARFESYVPPTGIGDPAAITREARETEGTI